MLVLTRKYQEKIRIGENITITVLRTKGKAVRLGIEAPADVPVIRGELAFEPPAAGTAMPQPTGSLAATGTAKRPVVTRRAEPTSSWTTQSPAAPASQVQLTRVPRDTKGSILPQLVSGSGPLRGMMDRR